MHDLQGHRQALVRSLRTLWARCSGCGNLAPVRAGTRDQPLCADCAAPDAGFWKTCPGCGIPGRILAGACRRCHLRDQARSDLLADPGTGHIRAWNR